MVLRSDADRPASALELFRTGEVPDKLYGGDIGSNYYEQLGSRVSKHFKPFDFAYAARSYEKLNRNVLVQDAKVLMSFRQSREGFEPVRPSTIEKLVEEIDKRGFFHWRYDCEDDEEVLQVIPYVLVFEQGGKVFTHARAKNIKDFGDTRLFGKLAIGLGGHIRVTDGPNYILSSIEREVIKEEVEIVGEHSPPRLVGTLMAYDKPVDRVHFGLIYTIHTSGRVEAKEPSITSWGMMSSEELAAKLASNPEPFETWSRKLIPFLDMLYQLR
jgi:predicted NUDIX family phosphoesterase